MDSSFISDADAPVEVKQKMHFTGTVTKISLAGALIDVGSGHPAVLHISQIISDKENEPVRRVEDVLQIGQQIEVWVRKAKGDHVELTMFKPLDLEWREIKKGMTVKGTVTRLEKFGAFVEIGAERPGLVHISEMAHGYVKQPSDIVKEGDEIEAEVLDVNRRKKQIKLSMKALQPVPEPEPEPVRPAASFPRFEKSAAAAGTAARKPKKSPRKQRSNEDSAELLLNMGEPVQNVEEEPTALGIAMREAMEKAKTKKKQQEEKSRKVKAASQEDMDILSRTLEQKRS